MRRARKWVGIFLVFLGFTAWSADVADRFGYVHLENFKGSPPNTGAIVWNFEDTAKGRGYFLNMQKPTGQDVLIVGFGAHGKNISDEPITDFDGYLRSDKTNEKLPIYILAFSADVANACTLPIPTLPSDTLGIPAFADFDVVTYKSPFYMNVLNQGVPLSKFLSEFVPFTVVLNYNGQKYQKHFSKADVDLQVAILEKLSAPRTNPFILRKKSAPTNLTPPPLSLPMSSNPDVTGKTK
jgi:hypothetical protein